MTAEKLIKNGVRFTIIWFAENEITFIGSSGRYVEGRQNGQPIKVVIIQRDHKPGRGKLKGEPDESVMLDHVDYKEKTEAFFTKHSRNYVVISRTYRVGDHYFPEQAYFVLVPSEIVELEFIKRKPRTPTSKRTCNIGFSTLQIRKWKDRGIRYFRMLLDDSVDIYRTLD